MSMVKLDHCFWCGESTSIVMSKVLNNKKFEDSPDMICTSIEPCDKCKETFAKGFLLMEATEKPNNSCDSSVDGGREIYPTSVHWVISNEVAKKLFNESILKLGTAFIDKKTATDLGLYDVKETT